jgi:epoxyqueuosine reductase QueG
MRQLRDQLEALAREGGIVAFGVADLDAFRHRVPEAFRDLPHEFASRAVVCAIRVHETVLESITDRPTPLYLHHYRQLNFALDRIALALAQHLQQAGHRALAIPASQVVRRSPMLGHVSHRELAYQAGLGWRGRNNLLVTPGFGSGVRLVSVLTDAPLPADKPLEATCDTVGCTDCVTVCPAGSIHPKPGDFDLPACAAKLDEFTRLPLVGQHICGICVKACRGPKTP